MIITGNTEARVEEQDNKKRLAETKIGMIPILPNFRIYKMKYEWWKKKESKRRKSQLSRQVRNNNKEKKE